LGQALAAAGWTWVVIDRASPAFLRTNAQHVNDPNFGIDLPDDAVAVTPDMDGVAAIPRLS